MGKSEYTKLLSEASVKNQEKFKPVSLERPKTRGRPVKNYHPLLQKEKQLQTTVRKILPEKEADSVCPKGSRLAHLYGLPKTHKPQLSSDQYYLRQELTISCWQNGWMKD